jgi:hypothetical protein
MSIFRPQLTVRSLLLSTALLGAGIGMLLMTIDRWMKGLHSNPPGMPVLYYVLQFLASGPLIGAGLFAAFGRWRLGAYVGFMIEIGWCLGWHVHAVGWSRAWTNSIFIVIFVLSSAIVVLAVLALLRRLWLYWQSRSNPSV